MGMATIRRWREEQTKSGEFKPSKRDEENNQMIEPILEEATVKKEAEKKKEETKKGKK
jgi:hypothetical protein